MTPALKLAREASDEEYVEQAVLSDHPANGGFPEPSASARVRVVAARHDACGVRTRVRLPGALPAAVVRRLRCAGCHASYEVEVVDELGVCEVEAPIGASRRRLSLPSLPSLAGLRERASALSFNPNGRVWRIASLPIAAAAVIGVLLLIQGSPDEAPVAAPAEEQAVAPGDAPAAAAEGADTEGAAAGGGGANASLVRTETFTIALPSGWERVRPEGGATFAAVAEGESADATLWVTRDPNLSFAAFETRSLKQLRSLAGSAEVAERVTAPTAEGTIVRIAADAPAGEPRYEATLRAAGPYRYYLATTLQPNAPRPAIDGVELIHGSLTPEANAG